MRKWWSPFPFFFFCLSGFGLWNDECLTTTANYLSSTEPPFDRHDWYVSRVTPDGEKKEVRYVIDFYSAPPEPTGEPVFYLDVRPAVSVTGACERLLRWGGDVWWKASGGEVREQEKSK